MLTLKQGKFYDQDGNNVPLEFGNKEQIKLLERVQDLRTEGRLLRGWYDKDIDGEIEHVSYSFQCICGKRTELKFTYEENNELETHKFTCNKCEIKYILEACDFSEFYAVVKMVVPKPRNRG